MDEPVSKQPTATTGQTPPSSVSKQATGEPATAMIRERLRAQQLATRKARAFYEIAKSTRELAEIAVEEYEEVIYPRDLATVEGEIKLAESDLTRSEDRLEWAKRMFERSTSRKARRSRKSWLSRRPSSPSSRPEPSGTSSWLTQRVRRSRSFGARSRRPTADELAKQAAWTLEKAKEIELERQLRLGAN